MGCERIFAVNVLGPYLLTALMPLPPRLVYLTSGLESAGRVNLDDLQWERRAWNGMQAYSDSKLYDVLLAFAVARRYPRLRSNAVDPGWIKTKLGGQGATDELPVGAQTQVWLAASDDSDAAVTGRYFKWRRDCGPTRPPTTRTCRKRCSPPARASPAPHCPTSQPAVVARRRSSGSAARHAVPATPIRLPSGSVKWPITRPVGARFPWSSGIGHGALCDDRNSAGNSSAVR